MAACAESSAEPSGPRVGTWAEPPRPLTPELRSDVAFKRADGHPWLAIGTALRYSPDALRRAAENDPAFPEALERARAEATWEAEAEAMRRLRRLADDESPEVALRASEVLVKYARERRRDDTRIEVEHLRAEAMRAKVTAQEPPRPVFAPVIQTEADRAALRDKDAVEGSTRLGAEVYLWGRGHPLGRSIEPDESDTRVRIQQDHSVGAGSRGPIYWVVPDEETNTEPAKPPAVRDRCDFLSPS